MTSRFIGVASSWTRAVCLPFRVEYTPASCALLGKAHAIAPRGLLAPGFATPWLCLPRMPAISMGNHAPGA